MTRFVVSARSVDGWVETKEFQRASDCAKFFDECRADKTLDWVQEYEIEPGEEGSVIRSFYRMEIEECQ